MNKTVFKILDPKGRITIPAEIRASLGIASGDVVAITADRGGIAVKKSLVMEDTGKLTPEVKDAFVDTVMREMPTDKLTDLLELAVRLLQERSCQ